MNEIWQTVLIFTALAGFLLAFFIRHKKKTHEKMTCPLDSDCNAVIESEYSRFFYIPVELLGLFYYGIIAASYALFLIFSGYVLPSAIFSIFILTIAAFLFSLYLTFIQAFAIKQWCVWCLTSAGLCTIIFAISLSTSEYGFIHLLAKYSESVFIVYFSGLALGFGGATVTGVLFLRFLKDLKISQFEIEVMKNISQVIWFSLAVILISGFGLYLAKQGDLFQSSKFLSAIVVLGTITASGAILNFIVTPKLLKISSAEKHKHQPDELHRERKIAFGLGAVSVISWYSIFVLSILKSAPAFFFLMAFYLLFLAGGFFLSQLIERSLAGSSVDNY